MSSIFTGKMIECRRTRLQCGGFHACEHLDRALLEVERYELEAESLDMVVAAQIKSRVQDGNTSDKLVLT